MCANKYENRQNDEYECCTPFHPTHMYENKRIHVFCSIQIFNRIFSFVDWEILKKLWNENKQKDIYFAKHTQFPLTEILAKLEFSQQNHSSFLCITHFLTK